MVLRMIARERTTSTSLSTVAESALSSESTLSIAEIDLVRGSIWTMAAAWKRIGRESETAVPIPAATPVTAAISRKRRRTAVNMRSKLNAPPLLSVSSASLPSIATRVLEF